MKNNFIFRLLPLITLAITLQSCRTNDDLLSSKEESYYSNKFQVFTSFNNEPVDYAKGFKILLEKYDSIHGTGYTRTALLKKGNFNKNDAEYVEFNLRSQEMLLDDGERWIVYPIIKNNQVGGLMVGILRDEETEVEFRTLDSGSSYYTEVIQVFRMAFMKSNLQQRSENMASRCGFDGSDACDIEEVIISPPPRPRPGGGGPKGGCTGLNNCMNPDIGGGGGPGGNPGNEEQTPCGRISLQKNDTNYKNKLDFLKGKTGENFEYGFRVGNPVAGSGQTGTQYQQLSNAPGSNTINFPIFSNTFGMMHSHFQGLVPIFSPDDINSFIKLLINAANNGIPLDTVYITLTNPDGTTYQLWGSSGINVSNLSMFDQNTIETILNNAYSNDYDLTNPSMSTENLQKNFLKFMRDKMGVPGAKMFSINDNGNASQISLNGDSLASPIPCP